jgi:hypothetical protein
METTTQVAAPSKGRRWTGRILSTLIVLFLLLDSIMKFFKPAPVLEACARLGWPTNLIVVLGVVLLACTVIYSIPATSVLGAILLTGYLGGAVAIHVRNGSPLFSQALFPIYMGVVLWLGLFLRDDRLRTFLPWRSQR